MFHACKNKTVKTLLPVVFTYVIKVFLAGKLRTVKIYVKW